MKFATEEIRKKAVKAYMDGKANVKQLSEIFGYSRPTICNWIRAYREERRFSPKPGGHRKRCFTDDEITQLQSLLKQKPDITLLEIKEHFNKTCSLSAIHNTIVKIGYVYKKKRYALVNKKGKM